MQNLPTPYRQQIHHTKYSRWRPELGSQGRREHWPETVGRYIQFWRERFPDQLSDPLAADLAAAIGSCGVVPSMRALMTAGPALKKDEIAGYNCSYVTLSRVEAFDEIMYMLMCGTGVGFSVENRYVSQLPKIAADLEPLSEPIVVGDSKYGWASAFRKLLKLLYEGWVPTWDTSGVRPAGAVLKTFGGRASGPRPLEDLFQHCVTIFTNARGRQLTSKEAHSIATKIGDIVVVGGVRRSAMISLFDSDDSDMRDSKSGEWFRNDPHFGMANNSAVWHGRPSPEVFMDSMAALIRGKSGEPGLFNRDAAQAQAARYGLRSPDEEYGTNPCGEIILRDRQLCNLSEVIARPGDEIDDLRAKVECATIFGTLQSTLTNFRYLSPRWSQNCEDERLLGVSIAGVMDHTLLNGRRGRTKLESTLDELREHSREVNADWAKRLGVGPSAAITCLKPSGNTSQLAGASSPLKPWHGKYFVRRNRGNKTDPVARFLVDQGVPHEDEVFHPDTTWVFDYPQRAPRGALTRHDVSAIEQLELWQSYHDHWCEHKPSVTINTKTHEWLDVSQFLFKHFDKMSGVALLPDEDHTYQQAPYEEITREQYDVLVKNSPNTLDWDKLSAYELDDHTEGHRELACSAGACELP